MLVAFLSLSLSIQKVHIVSCTHQKRFNFYLLYLERSSVHPSGTLKSLINGELRRYHLTNIFHKDFLHFIALLSPAS